MHNTTTIAYHFEGLVAVYCRPIESKDCLLRPCVQVCCSPWTIFDPKQNDCVDIGENPILRWKPILHDKATGRLLSDLELLKRSSLPTNQVRPDRYTSILKFKQIKITTKKDAKYFLFHLQIKILVVHKSNLFC